MIGLIWPLWYWVYLFFVDGATDTLIGRSVVGLTGLIPAFLSFKFEPFKKYIKYYFTFSACLVAIQAICLTHLNGYHQIYVFGSFLAFFAISIGFVDTTQFFIYASTGLGVSLLTLTLAGLDLSFVLIKL